LRFNVSHSGERVLLAFRMGAEVGADIERRRPDLDFAGLAESSFAPEERAAVLTLPPAERANLFYEYWTCKEACLKADGCGLSAPLDGFRIVGSERTPELRAVIADEALNTFSELQIRTLNAGPDYAAAVAASGDWDLALMRIRICGMA
jgi:4'-phosphopantetheinyl transferase